MRIKVDPDLVNYKKAILLKILFFYCQFISRFVDVNEYHFQLMQSRKRIYRIDIIC